MNNEEITKNKVISSLIWKFLEKGGVQGIQFVVTLILSRLVTPEDYGIIAILLFFIQISNVFIQTGFSTALIQKKDSDNLDFSSILYLTLLISLIFYLVIFFSAPFIAEFYKYDSLVILLRIIALSLIIGVINSVQSAYASKHMLFKKFFFSSICAVSISGAVGIYIAYLGYGVWALVVQYLCNILITTVVLFFTVKWRPSMQFSIKRVKELWNFGYKLLCTCLIDSIFNNVNNLVIGKVYSKESLGLYNRGQQFSQIIATNIDGSIQSVMLPAISNYKDDKEMVKNMTRKSISIASFIVMPLMICLAAIAKPLILLLLTEKWIMCVPYFQLACFYYATSPIHTANITAIYALGRSDISLKLEVIKKIVQITVLIITVRYSVLAMAIGQVIYGLIALVINSFPNRKLFNYGLFDQIKDIMFSIITSIIMFLCLYYIPFEFSNCLIEVVAKVCFSCVFYLGVAIIFRNKTFIYLLETVKSFINKKNKADNNQK